MRLGTRGHYTILALLDLEMNGQGAPVRLQDIAQRQNLPLPYLEQLFNALKNNNIVISHRGRNGGYGLASPAAEIAIDRVLWAVDEDIRARQCAAHEEVGCRGQTVRCLTHAFWEHLESHIRAYLSSLSLADVVAMRGTGVTQRESGISAIPVAAGASKLDQGCGHGMR